MTHAEIEVCRRSLQTASMIDACTTAARNYEIAAKAQEHARRSQWVSVVAMLAVVVSAVAAWIAAIMKS
ncbi:MAG: hypothetical protein JW955_04045 [Sedimentisphaerales bacterium]|nr:hypothetical protein [Sedimentisphaerales bacterium]